MNRKELLVTKLDTILISWWDNHDEFPGDRIYRMFELSTGFNEMYQYLKTLANLPEAVELVRKYEEGE